MSKGVTEAQIEEFRKSFDSDPSATVAQNAVSNADLSTLALRRDLVQNMDFSFSTKLDDWSATNQRRSGRCWLFATLNLFRVGAMRKMNVKKFELGMVDSGTWPRTSSGSTV